MRQIAKSKITLAILSIAFLLLNPAGICAGTAGAKSAAHPCCPKPACPHQQGPASSGCGCIDRQPVAPSAPAPAGAEQLVPPAQATPLGSAEMPGRRLRPDEFAVISPQDRFLQFRQLLL